MNRGLSMFAVGVARGVRVAIAVLLAGQVVMAQDAERQPIEPEGIQEIEAPAIADPVRTLVNAPYLTETERRELRVFHGLWEPQDLATPQLQARAALIRGAYDDPSFSEDLVSAELTAEALVARGELQRALDVLEGVETLRATRLRAEAFEGLGRYERAAETLEPLFLMAQEQRQTSAAEVVEIVRGLMVRTRVVGQAIGGGADFRAMNSALARARQALDRLHWPVLLAEAELLYDKDNSSEAVDAAVEALELNPRAARAWYLLGLLAADAFDFDRADAIALELDKLGASTGGPEARESILGDLLRVRTGLNRRDEDGAQEAIDRLVARAPNHPEVRALEAAVAAARFEFPKAESLVAAYDAARPDSPLALLEVGKALSDLRQYRESGEYLRRAAHRAPHWAEPMLELGLMELQAGRDLEGLHALRDAMALEPFNVRGRNSLELAEALMTYEQVESEHFVVRYDGSTTDGLLAREMLPVLEQIHERVAGDGPGGIDHQPSQKTTIDLMPDHRWFSVRITGVTGVHTMAASTGPVVALESPRVGRGHLVGEYDWPRVIQHEYTHTVSLSRTRNRIPHWFTEASAVYLEDAPRDESRARLLASALQADRLFDLDEINIAFVRPKEPNDRAQAYAQGHWMYEFMIERNGPGAVLRLMDLYALGKPEPMALREVLGVGPDEFLEEFKAWARAETIEWGLVLPEDVPDLSDLLIAEGVWAGVSDLSWSERVAWAGRFLAGAGPLFRAEWIDTEPTDIMIANWLEAYPEHPKVLEVAVKREIAMLGEPTAAMVRVLERWADACNVCEAPHRHLAKLYLDGAGPGPDAAIPHLEFLDAREQHSTSYAVALAKRYAARGEWELAREKAERATRIAPFDADWRELAARIAIQSKDFRTARRHIEALVELEPDRDIHKRRLQALEGLESSG